MRTSGLFPSNLDPFVFAMGLRGESRIQPPPPSFVISPSSINGSSKQRRRSERRLGTAQRGCRLFQMEELIEVASPISGRELDPTLVMKGD